MLLVIDEAQNLSLPALEEIRMLSNLETEKSKLIQIVLVGQPNLRDKLARPELEQLRQRITVSYHLQPLDADETAHYINHRLRRARDRRAARVPARRDRSDPRAQRRRAAHDQRHLPTRRCVFGYGEERSEIDARADRRSARRARGDRRARPAVEREPPRVGRAGASRALADDAARRDAGRPRRRRRQPPAPRRAAPADATRRRASWRGREQQLAQREQAMRQRERELAEQRRVLAEQYRLLKAQRSRRRRARRRGAAAGARRPPAPPATPRAAPAQPRRMRRASGAPRSRERRASFWRRVKHDAARHVRTRAGGFADDSVIAADAARDDSIAARARVGVVGLGYVGLPLAVEFARAGFDVTGIDLDAAQGRRDQRRPLLHPRRRRPRTSRRCVAGGQAARDDRLRSRRRARHDRHLRADAAAQDQGPGHVLHRRRRSKRSPQHLQPGHARHPRVDDLSGHDRRSRAADARGERASRPASTSSSRSRPSASIRATRTFNTHNIPKVVGGVDAGVHRARRRRSTARRIETVVPVSSTRVAEMVKLLENTFRAVNIGLVNELALMCDRHGHRRLGSDRRGEDQAVRLHAVLSRARASAATASRSIRSTCRGRRKQTGFEARFIELAGQVNGAMPHYVVDKVADALNTQRKPLNGSRVLIARRRLQARHRRHARVAGARRDGRCCTQKGAHGRLRRSVRADAARRASGPAATTSQAVDADARRRSRDVDCVVDPHRPQGVRLRRDRRGGATLIVDTRNAIERHAPARVQARRAARRRRARRRATAARRRKQVA